MLPSVTKKYDDLSVVAYFQFSFYCDNCGKVWKSEQYPFSLRDSSPSGSGEIKAHEIMWKVEHDAAYERANTDALLYFNKCVKCGKRVCDDCFSEFEPTCLDCESKNSQSSIKTLGR